MDKLKARDLDDLELAKLIEDHFGLDKLKKYPSGVWYFDEHVWHLMSDAKLKADATYVLSQNIDQVKDSRVKAAINIFKANHFEEDERFELGDPNIMSWGFQIGAGRTMLRSAWWVCTFPGIAILITVLAINLVGEGLNDALNPRLRERN